ncbi:MAG: sigma-E factor negative regulatory protein RseB [Actinomycetota bacterium]|nr:sigma-E factor negative regulatory protein RseB [Actinomycetota bacterium]
MSRALPDPGRGTVLGLAGPLTLLALLLCAASTAPSVHAAPTRLGGRADTAALALLQRASTAPTRVAYQGVQFVSAWNDTAATSMVVQIDHRPGYGTTVHSASTGQGPAADTFLPAGQAEPSVLGLASTLQLLAGNYTVISAGRRTVSGRPADLVEARWPGTGRPAARFWIDAATGLVLRREVYDQRGRITRASAFVEIEVGATTGPLHLPPAMPTPWSQEVNYSGRETLRSAGWTCPDALPGPLTLVDARRGRQGAGMILHLSYSDGLATVSLFEQRGRLDTGKLDGYRRTRNQGHTVYVRDGVPARITWSAQGTVFTVVADAPPRTVDRVVAALPHAREESGGWHRLGRGLNRVASWFNPFG